MPGPLAIILLIVGVLLARQDPRRMLPGVLLTLSVSAIVGGVLGLVLQGTALLIGLDEQQRNLAGGLLLLAVPAVGGVALGVALTVNGILMLRRERRSLAHLLSLLSGLAVLAALVLLVLVAIAQLAWVAAVLTLFVGPVLYIGVGLVAYLAWSFVYARIARRAARRSVAVVVLGSGLVDGRVPPLLAARVARGLVVAGDGLVVLSGGQGADEPRSEAEAMAEHARSLGADPERMLEERESRNTEENLRNTLALLKQRDLVGPITVVTSDYHAFRAATLMRRLGVEGHALGARTARYYLPSALLREYLAILRDHRVANAVAIGILLLPLLATLLILLFRLS